MKPLFVSLLLLGLSHCVPVVEPNGSLIRVNDISCNETSVIYTAEYDIVDILAPLNKLNNGESKDTLLFFILADNVYDQRIYKGLYVRKDGIVTKLLDYGKHVTAVTSATANTAYFAASDGIYTYNVIENKAEKYGILNDDIINIARLDGNDGIYILTADHVLYRVINDGTKKVKVNEVDNAQEIALDYSNNLYYISNNNVYAFDGRNIKRIEGVLKAGANAKFIRPSIVLSNGVVITIDNKYYLVFVNGASKQWDFKVEPQPTAYSIDSMSYLYFGHDKKIYECKMLPHWRQLLEPFLQRNSSPQFEGK